MVVIQAPMFFPLPRNGVVEQIHSFTTIMGSERAKDTLPQPRRVAVLADGESADAAVDDVLVFVGLKSLCGTLVYAYWWRIQPANAARKIPSCGKALLFYILFSSEWVSDLHKVPLNRIHQKRCDCKKGTDLRNINVGFAFLRQTQKGLSEDITDARLCESGSLQRSDSEPDKALAFCPIPLSSIPTTRWKYCVETTAYGSWSIFRASLRHTLCAGDGPAGGVITHLPEVQLLHWDAAWMPRTHWLSWRGPGHLGAPQTALPACRLSTSSCRLDYVTRWNGPTPGSNASTTGRPKETHLTSSDKAKSSLPSHSSRFSSCNDIR